MFYGIKLVRSRIHRLYWKGLYIDIRSNYFTLTPNSLFFQYSSWMYNQSFIKRFKQYAKKPNCLLLLVQSSNEHECNNVLIHRRRYFSFTFGGVSVKILSIDFSDPNSNLKRLTFDCSYIWLDWLKDVWVRVLEFFRTELTDTKMCHF